MDYSLSYSCAPLGKGILYNTYQDQIKTWAELFPDKDAFVEYSKEGQRKSLTCLEVLVKANYFGKYLMSTGVRKGEVIVFCMKNSIEMVIAILGVVFCGGIVVCTSSNLKDGSDVIEVLDDTKSKVLILDAEPEDLNGGIINAVRNSMEDLKLDKVICNTTEPCEIQNDILLTTFSDSMAADIDMDQEFPEVQPEDPVIYFQTSGSSGKPKLTSHPHYSWIECTRIMNEQLGINEHSVYFCDRPFGWGVGSIRTYLASGSTRVFVDTSMTVEKDSADLVSDAISAEGCTHAYIAGYVAVDLLNRTDLEDKFQSVDTIICSGERIPRTTSRLIGRFCRRIAILYGSTEMNGVSAFISNNPEEFENGLIGLTSPGVEIKLVDHKGRVVGRGESGELCARSIFRFTEYVGMPEKFAEVVDSNSWFHSGDIGHVRSDGNFVLDGRSSEQIVMATVKIFPFEIEKELQKCPGVVAAIATPVPDVRLKNAICACVVLDKSSGANLDNVKEFCERTFNKGFSALGISLRPAFYLEFDQFLTNANGKWNRRTMAEEAKNRLGL